MHYHMPRSILGQVFTINIGELGKESGKFLERMPDFMTYITTILQEIGGKKVGS